MFHFANTRIYESFHSIIFENQTIMAAFSR